MRKVMTNREWLNSLSDEELGYFLTLPCIKNCRYCPFYGKCDKDCNVIDWLKAERSESE